MRLVHQENIIILPLARKKALERCFRIKYIIVITDHAIRPGRHIQAHLKRAYTVFFRILQNQLARDSGFMCQQIIDRIVNPVKMPLCPLTSRRVTIRLLKDAGFLL